MARNPNHFSPAYENGRLVGRVGCGCLLASAFVMLGMILLAAILGAIT